MTKQNKQFKIMDTQLSQQKDTVGQILLTMLLSVGIACFIIIPIASYLIKQNYVSTVTSATSSMKTRAIAKFHILESQFETLFDYSKAIVKSDTIKILLTDYAVDPENEIFKAQKPYIERTLHEFVEFNSEIVNAKLIANNKVISQYSAYEFIEPENITFVEKGQKAISSFIYDNNKVFLDVAVNITDLSDEQNLVGKLVYRLNVTDRITKVLKPNTNSLTGSNVILLYKNQSKLHLVDNKLSNEGLLPASKVSRFFDFDILETIDRQELIYVTSYDNFGYKIQYNYKLNKALKDYTNFKSNTYAYASLLTAIMTLFVLAIFWKSKNNKSRLLAKQYSKFAKEINKKQTMLEGINRSVDEHISLKDLKGKYVYANNAFSKFYDTFRFGAKKFQDDDFMYSRNLINTFAKADDKVVKSSKPWKKQQVEITNEDGTRYFDITKWPQKDGDNVTGIVTIAHDRTEAILHEKQIKQLQNQAIEALVKTVEIKDPHLAGHHERMSYVASKIAQQLKLDESEILTLEYSARLAGIGKVFVPQALLTKPGKLTDDELEIIQTHVESALKVLNNIDFSLPVVDTIGSMYERLDGSGYPNGKTAEQINQLARILAISDAFCALIVPRAYRESMNFAQAIKVLEGQKGKYDSAILIILKEIVDKMPALKKDFLINLK